MSMLAKQAATFAELQQCLVKAARDLFDAYGMEVEHTPEGAIDPARGVMAVIGYAAEGLAGALVLFTSQPVVEALTPDVLRLAPDMITPDHALRDVLGEFSNMLVGRVKNQLLARGIEPLLATPTTVIGQGLELPVPRSGMSAWHRFSGKLGDIFVRLDATFAADFELGEPCAAQSPPIAEGEMVLF